MTELAPFIRAGEPRLVRVSVSAVCEVRGRVLVTLWVLGWCLCGWNLKERGWERERKRLREGEEEIERGRKIERGDKEREICVYYCWGMGEDICMYLMFLTSIIILLCFVLSSAFMVIMRHQVIPNMAFLSYTTDSDKNTSL